MTKPPDIKKLQGTYEKSREPDNPVEFPLATIKDEPGELINDYAKNEWSRVTGELNAIGLLQTIGTSLVIAYCNEMGIYFQATDELREKMVSTAQSGNQFISPYSTIANRSLTAALKIAQQFGFTPASAGKIEMPKKDGGFDI